MNDTTISLEGTAQPPHPTSEDRRIEPTFLDWNQWWLSGFFLAGCIFALTYMRAWSGETSWVHLMFWAAVATMVISATGLIASGPTRATGLFASITLGGLLYLPKLFHSPTLFNYFDELSHLRATEQLNSGAGLFLENPINKAVEFFPGLTAATGAMASATGLSTFVVGNILIATAHCLILGALFLLYERIGGSTRVGLLAVAVFAASPAFVFFNSYFAYESLALPLAMSALTALVLSDKTSRRTANGLLTAALLLLLTVVVTHHITSWAMAGLLLLIGVATIWGRGWIAPISKRTIIAAGVTTAAAAAWLIFVAPYSVEYVSPTFSDGADALTRIFQGSSEHRRLFYRSTAPVYEKYGTYLAVIILAVAFAIAIVKLVRSRAIRREYLTTALAIVGVTYFISLPIVALVTNSAVRRIWDFAFIGVAPLVALALAPLFNRINLRKRVLAAVLVFVIFLGGVVSRTSLHQALPGPYEPTADPLSMTSEVFAASDWLLNHRGQDNVVTGDRAAFEVLGSYGDQDAISGQGSGAQPWRIFLPRSVTPRVLSELDRNHVRYLVVDRRITESIPLVGWYYSPTEPGAETRSKPLPRAALDKFSDSPYFSRIYNNGNVSIYRYHPPQDSRNLG